LYYGELCMSGKKCLTSGTIKIYNTLSNKKPLFILEVFALWVVFKEQTKLINQGTTVFSLCIFLLLKDISTDRYNITVYSVVAAH
jgi:hypothetical protein